MVEINEGLYIKQTTKFMIIREDIVPTRGNFMIHSMNHLIDMSLVGWGSWRNQTLRSCQQ